MGTVRQGNAPTRALRRAVGCALAFTFLIPAGAAAALPQSGADPATVAFDGAVRAVAQAGGTTYLGGEFTHAGPRTGAGAALDGSGGLLAAPAEVAGGSVTASAPDGHGGWYIGGTFTSVGGQPAAGLAHVRPDGSLDPGFQASAGGPVSAIAVAPDGTADAGTVYVGGSFGRISGRSRAGLAAVDPSGAALPWDAGLVNAGGNGPIPVAVTGLAAVPVDLASGRVTMLVASGGFTRSNGADTGHIAAFWGSGAADDAKPLAKGDSDPGPVSAMAVGPVTSAPGDTSAAVYCYDGFNLWPLQLDVKPAGDVTLAVYPGLGPTQPPSGTRPTALAATDRALYVGGTGKLLTSMPAAGAPAGTTVPALPAPDGDVDALAVGGDRLFVGGTFDHLGDAARAHAGAVKTGDGTLDAWDPHVAGGDVGTLAVSGANVYAGGDFTIADAVERRGLAAIDSSGALTSFAPPLTCAQPCAGPRADAIATDGQTVWVGGIFTEPRAHLAAFDAASGRLLDGFDAGVTGAAPGVLALALQGSTLYVGGGFDHIGGEAHANLAALDAASGRALSFRADADQPVQTLLAACGALYAGGNFEAIAGAARSRLAELDPATGAVRAWDPGADSVVYALARGPGVIYAGGAFSVAGGVQRARIAALDADTGTATTWAPDADVTVRALAAATDAIYAGGSFNRIGGADRAWLAALDPSSGTALDWRPTLDARVWALDAAPDALLVGGDFRGVGTLPQQGFARLAGVLDSAASTCGEAPSATALSVQPEPVPAGPVPGVRVVAQARPTRVDLTRPTLRLRRMRTGVTVRVSEASVVVLRLERRVRGHWRRVRITRLRMTRAGSRTVRFGRLAHGRYRVVGVARDAAGHASRTARLELARRR